MYGPTTGDVGYVESHFRKLSDVGCFSFGRSVLVFYCKRLCNNACCYVCIDARRTASLLLVKKNTTEVNLV